VSGKNQELLLKSSKKIISRPLLFNNKKKFGRWDCGYKIHSRKIYAGKI